MTDPKDRVEADADGTNVCLNGAALPGMRLDLHGACVSRAEYDNLVKQRDLLREAFVAAYEGGKIALEVLRKLPCDDFDFPEDHPQASLEAGLTKAHEAFEKAKAVR